MVYQTRKLVKIAEYSLLAAVAIVLGWIGYSDVQNAHTEANVGVFFDGVSADVSTGDVVQGDAGYGDAGYGDNDGADVGESS